MTSGSRTVAQRVALVAPLLDSALGHVLDSPTCGARIDVECAWCGAVRPIPTSGTIPPPPAPTCAECPQLLDAASAWRRSRTEAAS